MMKKLTIITLALFVWFHVSAQQPAVTDTVKKVPADTVKASTPAAAVVQPKPSQPKPPRKDTRPIKDRIDWDLSTSFWGNSTQAYFNASLMVSYLFPKIFSVGAGPVYIYSNRKDKNAKLNGYGGQIFAKAQLLKFFHLFTSYQGISNQYFTDSNEKTRGYVDSWYAGAGLNLRMGKRGGFSITVLYDILYSSTQSPYPNAFTYQFGFGF